MYPILTRLPNLFVYSYTVVWLVGLAGVVGWSWWRADEVVQGWQDGFLLALALGVGGGRVAFVLGNWGYFATHQPEMWRIGQGGLGYYGVLVGCVVGLAGWCWWRGRAFTPYANFWAMPLLALHSVGWLACHLEGCAYGRPTYLGWWSADLPDSYGVWAVRYPIQLWGMGLCGLVWLGLWFWSRWGGARPSAAFTLIMANLVQCALSFGRGDTMPIWQTLRADTWLALLVIGLVGVWSAAVPSKPSHSP